MTNKLSVVNCCDQLETLVIMTFAKSPRNGTEGIKSKQKY